MKKIKYLIISVIALFFTWILFSYFAAKFFIGTNNVQFDDIEQLENLKVESLQIKTSDSINISTWYINNNSDKVIILLAGIRGNRLSQVKRAKFYLKNGFSVLLPDLRGTGKSEGDFVSFGWHEKKDLLACIKKLREIGYKKISAGGHSLGAATIVYANMDFQDLDFVILESCYDNISNAFKNRVKKYHMPLFLLKPIIFFTEYSIDVKSDKLVPEKLISNIKCPTLILAGDMEIKLPLHETEKIYTNCKAKIKRKHIFHKGKHEDFYDKFGEEYENAILEFLNEVK